MSNKDYPSLCSKLGLCIGYSRHNKIDSYEFIVIHYCYRFVFVPKRQSMDVPASLMTAVLRRHNKNGALFLIRLI